MTRIALIGSDSGHPVPFARILTGADQENRLDEIHDLVGVWSDHDESVDQLCRSVPDLPRYSIIDELLSKVDLALVVDDRGEGEWHVDAARRAMDAGVAVFVDKPLARSVADALSLAEHAAKLNVAFASSSAIPFAPELDSVRSSPWLAQASALTLTGPGTWWFYGVHLAELAVSLTGGTYRTILRSRGDITERGHCVRDGGPDTTLQLLGEASGRFHVALHGSFGTRTVTLSDNYRPSYARMLEAICLMPDGILPVPIETTIEALAILEAGESERAWQDGATILGPPRRQA